MINVKSISQYDDWSKNQGSELSLTSDAQLELSANNKDLFNNDAVNTGIDYLNADAIDALVSGKALIEVSLKIDNGSRKSYKFPFGEFVKLVAQNLAHLNGNSGGGFLTEDKANELYVKLTSSSPQELNTCFNFTGSYVTDDADIIYIPSGKCTFQDIETQGIKANDTINASNKQIQAGSVSTTTLTANSTITCGAEDADKTTITGDNIECDDITCDNLTSTTSLKVGTSGSESLNASATGVTVTNVTASASITTPTVNGSGSPTNLSLNADSITIPEGSSLKLDGGNMELTNGGEIQVGKAKISGGENRVLISKLRVGDSDDYDDKSNLEVDTIEIGNTVTAQRFEIKDHTSNIYMDNTGFNQSIGYAQLTAQAACWS